MCDACKAGGNEKGIPQIEVTPDIVYRILDKWADDLRTGSVSLLTVAEEVCSALKSPSRLR